MAKKKTAEELRKAAEAAEQRARALRAKARKATQAEEAKINSEIIASLRLWVASLPEDKKTEWQELPQLFRGWAEKNRLRSEGNDGMASRFD